MTATEALLLTTVAALTLGVFIAYYLGIERGRELATPRTDERTPRWQPGQPDSATAPSTSLRSNVS